MSDSEEPVRRLYAVRFNKGDTENIYADTVTTRGGVLVLKLHGEVVARYKMGDVSGYRIVDDA